jgi:RNA polymerase sigma factor (sigma-70 family)
MPDTPFDNQLLQRCKAGDNAAFRDLYGRFSKQMLNASYRIVNKREEAEDILQEAFIKAFQNISAFDSLGGFGGWLKKVVVNRSIDAVRRKKPVISDIDIPESVDEEDDAEEEAEYDMETVRKCVQQLPDGYRLVLTLFLFEDFTHKEIAAMLNISESTSKSQYMRARNKLARLIQENSKMQHEPKA